jgi:hypothetical protein
MGKRINTIMFHEHKIRMKLCIFVSGVGISIWKEIGNTLFPAFYLAYLTISL